MTFIYFFIIPFIIILLFIIIILYKKIKSIKNYLAKEIAEITEKLSKLAYGNLTTAFDLKNSTPCKKKSNLFLNEIINLKKQFNEITCEPLNRICYVGSDPYNEGYKCGYLIGEKCESNSEIVILVSTNLNVINMFLRVKGFTSILKEKFPTLKIIEVFEANADKEKTYEFLKNTLHKKQNIKGIYSTGSSMGPIVSKCLLDLNKAGKIFCINHDIDKEIAISIKHKAISAALITNTLAQGQDSVVHIFNHIVKNWKPIQPRLLTFIDFINYDNLNKYWDFYKNELQKTEEIINNLIKPLKKSEKKIKIMVFGEDWNTIFLQINTGINDASQLLKKFNAQVDLFIINQAKNSKDDVVKKIDDLIKKAITEKYDGIVTYIGKKEIVPYLNKAASSGIPIVTYNSEPNNLRDMVKWLNDTSKELENFSNEYQSGHEQINNAMKEILNTIQFMVSRIIQQTESAKKGVDSVENIMGLLNESVTKEEKQMKAVMVLSEISNHLSGMINNFNTYINEMKEVQSNVNFSVEKISAMNDYSKQINSILHMIEEISSQTKLLSLNAAVEASRAGESGKGFKVVADEVGKLSEKSNRSTNSVSEIIKNIQNLIIDSNEAMNKSKDKIDIQVKNITDAINNIENVSGKLILTMNTVKSITEENRKNISEMKNSSNTMAEIINDSSNKAQDNTSAIEEISATIAEITQQFNEMNKQTNTISDIVKVLKGSVAQFYTE